MKKDTDFDALLAGHSPEDARRLQKILAQWARGDEEGFPVQLALLTRAQWRASAAIPASIERERNALVEQWGRAKVDLTSASQGVRDEFQRQIQALRLEVTVQSAAVKDAAATMRLRIAETDKLAREIREGMAEGQQAWSRAKSEFEGQRRHLEEELRLIRETTKRDTWIGFSIMVGLAILVGFGLGIYVGEP